MVVVLPANEVNPSVEDRVRRSIARYCDLRRDQLRHSRGAQIHDGLGALAIGLPVLFGGLALITVFHETSLPSAVETFFADGLILVIAWVAVWYPLDTLLYYGRSIERERHVLGALREMELVLRSAADVPAP